MHEQNFIVLCTDETILILKLVSFILRNSGANDVVLPNYKLRNLFTVLILVEIKKKYHSHVMVFIHITGIYKVLFI